MQFYMSCFAYKSAIFMWLLKQIVLYCIILPENLVKIVNSLNNTNGGHNGIPTNAVRNIIYIISAPLAEIFNNCIDTGYFPCSLKIARVVSIFKAKNLRSVQNFRPISILSVFGKIFERYIHSQMLISFSRYKIIC